MTSLSGHEGRDCGTRQGRTKDKESTDRKSSCPTPSDNPCLRILKGHTANVTCACVLQDYVITCSTDTTVRFWRQADGKPSATLKTKVEIQSLVHARLRDVPEYLLLIGCCQGDVELFRGTVGSTVNFRSVGRCPFHAPNPVTALAVSPDHLTVASATCFRAYVLDNRTLSVTTRGGLKLWRLADILDYANDDVTTGSGIQPTAIVTRTARQLGAEAAKLLLLSGSSLDRHVEEMGVRCVVFSPCGSLLVVGFGLHDDAIWRQTWSKTLIVCSSRDMAVVHVYNGTTAQVRHLVTASESRSDDRADVTSVFVQTPINLMKIQQIRQISDSGCVRIRFTLDWKYTSPDAEIVCLGMALSPDGAMLVSAHGSRDRKSSGRLLFHDATTGKVLLAYDESADLGLLTPSCFDVDGSVLFAIADDNTVTCLRVPRLSTVVTSAETTAACAQRSRTNAERNGRTRKTANSSSASEPLFHRSTQAKYKPKEETTGQIQTTADRHEACPPSNCFNLFSGSKLTSGFSSVSRDSLSFVDAVDEDSDLM